MQREVIWRSDDGIGAEYLLLEDDGERIAADSVVFASRDVTPSRTTYRAEMDRDWHVRRIEVTVSSVGEPDRSLHLTSDGAGHWNDAEGRALPQVDGCLDIDISATPFTNTLPIRRLHLQPGQIRPIRVLYIHIPTLRFELWEQQYTGLATNRVRYESLGTDFMRELKIDADGLVVDYPGLFTRVYAT